MGSLVAAEQREVLGPRANAVLDGFDPMADVAADMGARRFRDDVDMASWFFLRFYMAGHILPKADTASMAASLEARAPFLDTALAELACGLPSKLKYAGGARKVLLRRMLRGRLPKAILDRPKKGFGIPLNKWLKGGLRELVEGCLAEDRLRREGWFDPAGVRALVDGHMSGKSDNRKQLWTLVVFQMWKDRVLG
jgi:asparagine synthase (glutamine-hydrolysing)